MSKNPQQVKGENVFDRKWMISVVCCLAFAASLAAAEEPSGYWKYVRTDTYVVKSNRNFTDLTPAGGEGKITIISEFKSYGNLVDSFGATFTWNAPPPTLTPGAVIGWPISVTIAKNMHGPYSDSMHFWGVFYPYQVASNLENFNPYASAGPGRIDITKADELGKSVFYNCADHTPQTKVPGRSAGDANGYMTWLVSIEAANTYYWSYIYQWVAGQRAASSSAASSNTQTSTTASTDRSGAQYTDGGSRAPLSPSTKIFDNFDQQACGLTDTSTFNLKGTTRIDKIDLWYRWPTGERQVSFSILSNNRIVASGTLHRAGCDAYQTRWCMAETDINQQFKAGSYSIQLGEANVCQNGGSGGNGFVQIYGGR